MHEHEHGHGHSHGLVDRSIVRSREGVKAVSISLAVLGVARRPARDFRPVELGRSARRPIHTFGDALTALPLGVAFLLRSLRGEKLAGLAVVLAIFVSACVALYETIARFIHPRPLHHLGVLAAAGAPIADLAIGLVITLVILRITWQSWRTVSTTDPGEMLPD